MSLFTMLKRLGTAAAVLALPLAGHAQGGAVVFSQVYGGGGGSTATTTYSYKRDFVELFNRSSKAVDLSGYSIQYASATGTTGTYNASNVLPANTILQPGKYYFISLGAAGTGGADLPASDFNSTGPSLAATAGRVALVNNSVPLAINAAANAPGVVDFVGYGTTAITFETAKAPAPSTTTSLQRKLNGCTDANDNSTDFTAAATLAPRTNAIAASACGTVTAGVTIASTADQTIPVSTNGTPLRVAETGTASTRQWASGAAVAGPFTNISGETGINYAPNFATAGTYYVVVKSTIGGTVYTSNAVKITTTTVAPLIAITQGTTAYASTSTFSGFANTLQGSSSAAVTFTITNASTTDNLTISAIATTGNFAVSNILVDGVSATLPITVPKNSAKTATFDLTFSPTASGTRTGKVTLTNDSQTFPSYVINLSGQGLGLTPTLTDITTSSLLVGVPSIVLISGTNFDTSPATTVNYIGGTVSNVTNSGTFLHVTLTPTAAGAGTVSVTTSGGTSNTLPMAATTPPTGFFEPFESVELASYLGAPTVLALSSGNVTANGIVLTTTSLPATDKRKNSQSARLRPSGYVQFARPNGVGTVTLQAAVFGTQSATSPSFTISYSLDNGTTFIPVVGTPADGALTATLSSYSYPVNAKGSVLLRITNTAVYVASNPPQVNIDDVQLTDFSSVLGDLTVNSSQNVSGNYNDVTVENGGVATLTGTLIVNGTLTVKNNGVLVQNCQIITGPGKFDLQAGSELRICDPNGITATGNPTGAVQLAGTRTYAPGASYTYNGTVAQVTGSGLPSTVRNLTLNNTTGLTLSQAVSIAQVASLQNGNLTTGGKGFTLLSDAQGTALIVNANSGTVVGSATVQRYIDPSVYAGPAYRHLSAPVSGSNVADLDNTATGGTFAPEVSQAATYNASATPGTTTPFPTVFFYVQSRVATAVNNYTPFDKGFKVPTSTIAPLAIGSGYAVHMRANEVVDFVGTPTTGDQTLTLSRNAAGSTNAADAGWQLVGNPYPSPLNYSLVALADRTGLDAAIYVSESNSPYTGTYRANVNGVGGNANSPNPLIGMAQGFFVRVSSGQTSGTLTFRNDQRVKSFATQVTVRRGTADARPLVQLTLAGTTGAADAFNAYAETGTTPGFDAQYDALKLPNTTGLNLASLAVTGQALAIDGRPAFSATTVLALSVGVPAAGTYSLSAAALNNLPTGLEAFLTDAATGKTVNMSQQPSYSFSVSPAQAAALMLGRFTLHFGARSVLATAQELTAAAVTLYPNPAHRSFTLGLPALAGQREVRATLFNALGQPVATRTIGLSLAGATSEFQTESLAPGVYTLRLQATAQVLTKRVVIE